MLNYINKYVYLPKMAPLKQGNRGFMGIRGVWGGVIYDRDVVIAPPHGIHFLLDLEKQPQYGSCKSLSLNIIHNHFVSAKRSYHIMDTK